MANLDIFQQILFRTSASTDVLSSGGIITVPGLSPVNKKRLTSITQVKYRPEVAQVKTIGDDSYTPVGATLYEVAVYDPNRRISGGQEAIKLYGYTTPDDVTTIGATAALQREAIHTAIVTAINADASNHSVAASLGTGTGFTVTDDGGYYPVHAQSMTNVLGVNTVLTTSGFTSDPTATTTGVYSVGVGANLLLEAPVADWMNGGNFTSGIAIAPKTLDGLPAVSGQNYDLFAIQSLTLAPSETASGQQLALVNQIQQIWIDNGTGSSTTNLANFKAVERVLHKLIAQVYESDASSVVEFFDAPIVFQDPLGAAPSGTANTLGWQAGASPKGHLNRTNIGTQTIVAPVLDDTGLLLDQDDNAGDGSHTSANQQVLGDQSFIVGKSPYTVIARVVAADWTDTQFMVGLRKKAVYTADYNDYTDLAAIGGGAADGDSITTQGILNNAATVATDSGANFADGVSMLLMIKVAIDGTVTAYYANTSGGWTSAPIYSAGTTTLVLDAGDEFIAFYQHVNIGSGNPAVSIGEFFAFASTDAIA